MVSHKMPLAVVGPTASGKTRLSLILGKHLKGEIISADSRQIYKYLTIGTSKPTEAERSVVPHHLIDLLDPREPMSAGFYGRQARQLVTEIERRGRTPILVGGSGLYIKAVIDGLFDGPPSDAGVRSLIKKRFDESGLSGLLDDLRRVDPQAAAEMQREPKVRRIQRALEVYYATGISLSDHFDKQREEQSVPFVQVALRWRRENLYKRINSRVDGMITSGFLEEVRWLKSRGYGSDLNSLNTVGYKELFAHLNCQYDLPTAVDLIKRNTRRFAKRQGTWFNADKRIHWLPVDDSVDWNLIAERVLELYHSEA